MNAAEIVERNVQRDRGKVTFQPLAKAIAQSSKPLRSHAQRQILPLHIACRNLFGLAAYYLALYGYYSGRRIAPRCFGYVQVGYAVGLVDDAVRSALAERVADC